MSSLIIVEDFETGLTLPHFVPVSSKDLDFQNHMLWSFFVFCELRGDCIDGIFEHHCFNFLFIKQFFSYIMASLLFLYLLFTNIHVK